MTLDSSYYTSGSVSPIVRDINRKYQQDISLQQQFWVQADIDLRFKAGDQTLWPEIYGALPAYSQRQFNFNKIRRIINLISGHQRKNRKSLIIVPQENEDQDICDQLSGVLQWVMSTSDCYHTISEAFESAITTGFSLICPWIDYRNDPISGDIKFERLDYNGFMIDPHFKKQDLSDAEYIWTRKYVTKNQAKALFPGRDNEIDSMRFTQNRDGKFSFLPENFQFAQSSDLAALDWYWYQDSREATFLHDPDNGECVEWTGTDDDLELFSQMHDHLSVIKTTKPTTKVAVLLNGQEMYNGPNPWKTDSYPFVGCFGYFEPNIPYYWWKIQGVVRGLRDAQYLYNHKKRIEMDILESQINSGLKVKEGALVDPKDAFMSGQGRVLFLKQTASLDDVQTIAPPGIDPTMIALTQSLEQEMLGISGVNEELLGAAEDDKAGVLSMLRQGAGLTTLQRLFDQLDQSMKQLGRITLEMIQNNFSPGKVRRILGEDPHQRFSDKVFGKYDCHIEEGVMTSTQKQMQFQQLLYLRELGIPVPNDALINAATLQNKKDLIEAIENETKQKQQLEQTQIEQQMQSQQVLSQTLLSKAASDKALAIERMNKIGLDKALNIERISRAKEERDSATLSRIKAAKELTEIDLNQIERAMNIIKMLQEGQKNEEELPHEAENILSPQGGYEGIPQETQIPQEGRTGGSIAPQETEEVQI